MKGLKLNIMCLNSIIQKAHEKLYYDNTPMNMAVKRQFQLFIFFLVFAQTIDCGYTLEPPQ